LPDFQLFVSRAGVVCPVCSVCCFTIPDDIRSESLTQPSGNENDGYLFDMTSIAAFRSNLYRPSAQDQEIWILLAQQTGAIP
jgi:hypothetical protein